MMEYVREIIQTAEQTAIEGTVPEIYGVLRRMGLSDFGELMFSLPNPDYPHLSQKLPVMASVEVQKSWTGNSGLPLLKQSANFVRSAAHMYASVAGKSLQDKKILDFGCGYGRIARLMYYFTNPENLFGVDPWDKSIALCREAGLGDNFLISDYLPTTLPVDEANLDFIYAFSVFTHLSERATRLILPLLRRYIRPDGMLVITVRPIEYWSTEHQHISDTSKYIEQHRNSGFAFFPHNRQPIDGDITYGQTSASIKWITDNFPQWSLIGVDRSLDDIYQIYLFLRPA